MSDLSSRKEEREFGKVSELSFVKLIQQYPSIFYKSQTPAARKEKSESVKLIKEQYVRKFGKEISEMQILKKLQNMKTRLKKKIELEKTAGRKVVLKESEHLLFEVLQDDFNPKTWTASDAVLDGYLSEEKLFDKTSASTSTERSTAKVLKKQKLFSFKESEETKHLSNEELQRLVFLEQLEVLRLKKQKLLWEMGLDLDLDDSRS